MVFLRLLNFNQIVFFLSQGTGLHSPKVFNVWPGLPEEELSFLNLGFLLIAFDKPKSWQQKISFFIQVFIKEPETSPTSLQVSLAQFISVFSTSGTHWVFYRMSEWMGFDIKTPSLFFQIARFPLGWCDLVFSLMAGFYGSDVAEFFSLHNRFLLGRRCLGNSVLLFSVFSLLNRVAS